MGQIKNLKFDPEHENKPRSAYNHLEYLDKVIDIKVARKIESYELEKYNRNITLKVVEAKKTKASKNEIDG